MITEDSRQIKSTLHLTEKSKISAALMEKYFVDSSHSASNFENLERRLERPTERRSVKFAGAFHFDAVFPKVSGQYQVSRDSETDAEESEGQEIPTGRRSLSSQ